MKKPKKKKKKTAARKTITRTGHNSTLEMYLTMISRGALAASDFRRMLMSTRQAIADWAKLGTPFALEQASLLEEDVPLLRQLFEASEAHEKKHPIITTIITH